MVFTSPTKTRGYDKNPPLCTDSSEYGLADNEPNPDVTLDWCIDWLLPDQFPPCIVPHPE